MRSGRLAILSRVRGGGNGLRTQLRLRWYYATQMNHDELMAAALDEARRARDAGEVPIGAVVAIDGTVVGRGFNQPISSGDPTAHAEIVAIRAAARAIGNYRLTGAILCVTIEPCLMCVGALVHARIGTLVFGAAEPKSGAVSSTVRGGELPGHNHRFEVVAGVREADCRALMQAFFSERRTGARASAGGQADVDEL
ncbi:MAG TPA: tRNA adenosine(34) deaminase TadA [Vicinamibacterales bacterium]|nr:tRNA adenosine(34) deaminase TadA [Vicinamibacterales bacterium]